jgi:hypothetical protein
VAKFIVQSRPFIRPVGTVLCLMLFGIFILAAVPAHADNIYNVTLSSITVTGNNSCIPAPCSETFNISLVVDTTIYTLLHYDLETSGVLENGFLYADTYSFNDPSNFVFIDGSGNGIGWNSAVDLLPATGTFSATSPPSVGFGCGPLAHPCVDDGLGTVTGGTIQVTSATPSVTTPEPSSLFLLGTSFLCAIARRLKNRV